MAEPPVRQSPLHPGLIDAPPGAAAVLVVPGLRVAECPFKTHHVLRSRDPARLACSMADAIGVDLPTEPNTTTVFEAGRVIWHSPSEWLVFADEGTEAPLGWVAAAGAHAIDLSSGQTLLRIEGPRARELISAGCTLDLHPRAFPVHAAAQSLIAKAPVTLVLANESPTYEIAIRRSYAPYLWRWLEVTSRTLG